MCSRSCREAAATPGHQKKNVVWGGLGFRVWGFEFVVGFLVQLLPEPAIQDVFQICFIRHIFGVYTNDVPQPRKTAVEEGHSLLDSVWL